MSTTILEVQSTTPVQADAFRDRGLRARPTVVGRVDVGRPSPEVLLASEQVRTLPCYSQEGFLTMNELLSSAIWLLCITRATIAALNSVRMVRVYPEFAL